MNMLLIPTMQNIDLQLESYDFDLPHELIADRPVEGRQNSKLLVYKAKSNTVEHKHYYDLPNILSSDHLLVLNQSKVFPCRLYGEKPTGGKAEVFILSLITENGLYPALIKARGKKSIGDKYVFGDLVAEIKDFGIDGSFLIAFNKSENEKIVGGKTKNKIR